MKNNWPTCFALVLKNEGGYVNNPAEGQRAALGQAMFYPCFGGHLLEYGSDQANQEYGFDLKTYDWLWEQYIGHSVTNDDIKALTPNDVEPLYKTLYWDKVNGD